MTNKKFLDYAASVTGAEYTVYSVNHNGMSKGISVTGKRLISVSTIMKPTRSEV